MIIRFYDKMNHVFNKRLIKRKKQIEVQIKKLSKTRLNDRTSDSWLSLRELKKENWL